MDVMLFVILNGMNHTTNNEFRHIIVETNSLATIHMIESYFWLSNGRFASSTVPEVNVYDEILTKKRAFTIVSLLKNFQIMFCPV